MDIECKVCLEACSNPMMLQCLHLVCAQCMGDVVRDASDRGVEPKCLECGEVFDPTRAISHVKTSSNTTTELACTDHQLAVLCETCRAIFCKQCTSEIHKDHVHIEVKTAILQFKDQLTLHAKSLQNRLTELDASIPVLEKISAAIIARLPQLLAEITTTFDAYSRNIQGSDMLTGVFRRMSVSSMNAGRSRRNATLTTNTVKEKRRSALWQLPIKSWFSEPVKEQPPDVAVIQEAPPNPDLIATRVLQIESWRDELRANCKKTLDSDAKTIDLQSEGLGLLREQLRTALQQIEQASVAVSELTSDSLSFYDLVTSRAENLLSTKPSLEPLVYDSLRFTKFLIQKCDPLVASLDYLGRLDRPRNLDDFQRVRFPSYVIDGSPTTFTSPVAIACNRDGNLVVAGSDKVVVVTPAGELRLTIPIESPVSVAVGDGGDIWVVTAMDRLACFSNIGKLKNDFRIHNANRVTIAPNNGDIIVSTLDSVIALTPSGQERWRSEAADGATYGLAVTPSSELLTGNAKAQTRCLLSLANGSLLRNLGNDIFPAPADVAVTTRFFVASDMRRNCVAVFHHNGILVHRFGEFGSKPGQFNSPGALAILPDDRVAVCDIYNFRIQLF